MKPIVVIGSINSDLVCKTPRIPRAGETLLGDSFHIHSGGKGANQAVAVARLGYPSILLGKVGTDAFGDKLLAALRSSGVETTEIRTASAPTGTAIITVDSAGENSIVVVPGANAEVTPEYVETRTHVLASAAMVLLQLEIPIRTVEWVCRWCKQHGVPVMLDPAPAQVLPADVLQQITWFTPNETEAAFYAAADTPQAIVARLRASGIANIALKRGPGGTYIAPSGQDAQHVPTFSVAASDTTAAGDTFNAAFAVALARGEPTLRAARFASAAAAISVTRPGAQESMPTQSEVLKLFASTAE